MFAQSVEKAMAFKKKVTFANAKPKPMKTMIYAQTVKQDAKSVWMQLAVIHVMLTVISLKMGTTVANVMPIISLFSILSQTALVFAKKASMRKAVFALHAQLAAKLVYKMLRAHNAHHKSQMFEMDFANVSIEASILTNRRNAKHVLIS